MRGYTMYKTVIRASEYEMSIDGNIRRKDGLACTLTTLNDEPAITLVIYGKERTVTLEWLRLMTHFEVDLKYQDFWNTYFVPVKKWHKGNSVSQTMLFYGRRPEYKPGFRIIPCFTRYAVSREGVIVDTFMGMEIKHVAGGYGYLTVSIYNPDISKYSNMLLHRLVALAWVKNPDHLKYYLVNHKDGNKHNPYYENLEWTDHRGNIQHAYSSNLRTQNTDCKIRNIETNEITVFISLREACNFMGIAPRSYNEFVRWNSDFPINGKYQLKLLDDKNDWDYTLTTQNNRKTGKITVIYEDGKIVIVYGIKALNELFGLFDKSHKKRDYADSYAKQNGITIIYDQLANLDNKGRTVEVYDIKNEKITEYNSILEASKVLNTNPCTIRHTMSNGETFVTNGYAYRYKTDKKWNTNFSEAINRPKCILAINQDGIETECNSLREAELLTKVNRKAIRRALHGITIQTNWQFKFKQV